MEGTRLTHIFCLIIVSICLGITTKSMPIFAGSIIVASIITIFMVMKEIKGDEK